MTRPSNDVPINQARKKSAPVISQFFTDQKCERHDCHRRQRDWQTRGGGIDPENFKGADDEPVKQRRFRQPGQAVVRRP